MNDTNGGDVPPTIASAADWSTAVRWAVEASIAARSRRLWCYDTDFADWPLDDRPILEAWTRWLMQPQRRLTLLADHWSDVARRHPRFANWRRDWSHAIETLTVPSDQTPPWPAALVDDHATLLLLHDRAHWRGVAAQEAARAAQLRQEIDALSQRSAPDFPVTQLGL